VGGVCVGGGWGVGGRVGAGGGGRGGRAPGRPPPPHGDFCGLLCFPMHTPTTLLCLTPLPLTLMVSWHQTVFNACVGGTMSPLTLSLAAEAFRESITLDFVSTSSSDTAVTSSIDVDWLASQSPTEVCVRACFGVRRGVARVVSRCILITHGHLFLVSARPLGPSLPFSCQSVCPPPPPPP
jgi:hypothetical protein